MMARFFLPIPIEGSPRMTTYATTPPPPVDPTTSVAWAAIAGTDLPGEAGQIDAEGVLRLVRRTPGARPG